MVLHLREGEAIFGVFVPFGDDALHGAALLEQSSEFVFELLGLGLGGGVGTLPSRLVMKSLLVWLRSSERERSLSRRFGLEELDYDMISISPFKI